MVWWYENTAISVAERSKVLAFAKSGMQAILRTCGGHISAVLNGRSPTIKCIGGNSFSTRLQVALGRLRRYSELGAPAASAMTLFGSEVTKAKVQAMLARNRDELRFNDLQFSVSLAFPLDTTNQQKLQNVNNEHRAQISLKEGSDDPEALTVEQPRTSAADSMGLVEGVGCQVSEVD